MALAHGIIISLVVIIASTALGGSPLPAALALCVPCSLRGRVLLMLGGLLLWLWIASRVEDRHQLLLPVALDDRVIATSGQVVGLPECGPAAFGETALRQARFELLTSADSIPGWPGAHRLRLSWYLPSAQCATLLPGETLNLQLRLRRSGSGDKALLDLRQGIHARGAVVSGREGHGPPGRAARVIDRWRLALSDRLRAAASAHPEARAILPALVSGDRRGLDAGLRHTLSATGTAHLVAISGLHISLVVWLVLVLVRRPLQLLSRRVPLASVLPSILALSAATLYAAMAGFAVSTSRALVMTALLVCLASGGRRLPAFSLLWLALAALLLLDPFLAGNPGLWMSVGAVYLLMLMGRRQMGVLRGQLLLTVALAPLAGWWFAPPGAGAWLANLVLVPVFSLLLIPLSLLAALLDPVLAVVPVLASGLAWLWPWLETLARWPAFPVAATALLAVAWSTALTAIGLRGAGVPRWPLLVLLLPLWLSAWQRPEWGRFTLQVFDVGQGSAQAIVTRDHLLLFDTGPRWPGGDAAQTTVLPWLRRQPQALHTVLVSHGDSDHAGGMASLLSALAPAHILSGEPQRVRAARACYRGQRWQLDGVRFEVLWPAPNLPLQHSNNRSCVLRVEGNARSLLLSGDITRAVEYVLVQSGVAPVDMLQVPHHGSHGSSSFPFVRALRPRVVYTGTSPSNPFGHPHPAVVSRYRSMGARVFDTGTLGSLSWTPQTPLVQPRSSLDQQWRSPWRWVSPVVE